MLELDLDGQELEDERVRRIGHDLGERDLVERRKPRHQSLRSSPPPWRTAWRKQMKQMRAAT